MFAQENARIARERFEIASLRFEAGEMGLSEWRSEEERLMQAEEQVRVAERQREEAVWNLSEVLFGGCMDAERFGRRSSIPIGTIGLGCRCHGDYEGLDLGQHQVEEHLEEAIRTDIFALLASVDQDRIYALMEQYDLVAQQAWFQLRQSERQRWSLLGDGCQRFLA